MLAIEFDYSSVEDLVETYLSFSSIRDKRLFSEFLPSGYSMTTISTVHSQNKKQAILAKMHLGMLITLMDDLADNPKYRCKNQLEAIYSIVDRKASSLPITSSNLQLAEVLTNGLYKLISELPHGNQLIDFLEFDVRQIVLANQYSELISDYPDGANLQESLQHGPYNMGIVAAGTIDLMATKNPDLKKLSTSREVFLAGQRMGRIANVLTTFKREEREGDLTNETSIYLRSPHGRQKSIREYQKALFEEFFECTLRIQSLQHRVDFCTDKYIKGFQDLLALHQSLEGKI